MSTKFRVSRLTTGLAGAIALAGVTTAATAQDLPTSQPPFVSIVRERVKPARDAQHAKIEAGWPAAFAKAKFPDYYIAITSMTGPGEAWFISPFPTYAAMGASLEKQSADPALSADLERLSKADAEVLDGLNVVQLRARPELSQGAFPDIALVRYYQITVIQTKVGHGDAVDSILKINAAVAQRAGVPSSFRVYQVAAGMPGPTYFIFSTQTSFADYDVLMANGAKAFAAQTPEEQAALSKYRSDITSNVTNRYRIDPKMSYVSAATRAKDPKFWGKM